MFAKGIATRLLATVSLLSTIGALPFREVQAQPRERGERLTAADRSETVTLSGPSLTLTFTYQNYRLALMQMQCRGDKPVLYADKAVENAGPGPLGNPLAVVVKEGKYKGAYGMKDFHVTRLNHTETRLLAYLENDSIPLLMAIDVAVEGNVATWRGQACWNGDEAVEADLCFPLLSRVCFEHPDKDRALLPQTSGSVREPLSKTNYTSSYLGRLSCPVFLVEGGGRGLAVLDDNRSDLAADPGACSLRTYAIGNTFQPLGSDLGPFVGITHTRRFRPISEFGGEDSYNRAESHGPLPMRKLGESVDLGPIRMYAYSGAWKVGAAWLRERRQHVPFRISPARWYQRTTVISESGIGPSFLNLPNVLAERRKGGADFFHLISFHEPEILNAAGGQDRGDYFFMAQNLGGIDGARQGIEALHRAGGHAIFYAEGLIMWKRSRIGRTSGKDWALMEPNGTYTEHYKGFWHMCPACSGWQDWFAKTLAEIVRTTGIDGFFIDSTLATYNHRCFNPAHNHPHPDVWNWGVRHMLRRVREEVDKVNPETILILEGCGDLGREFIDGTVAHGSFWTNDTFTEPVVRFLHPQMRGFESWGYAGTRQGAAQKQHIRNSVNGYRIYAHGAGFREMAELSLRTRQYYDAFPEICDNPMSVLDVKCENGIAQMFEGSPNVITVGNITAEPAEAALNIPVHCSVLFDRVDSSRLPVTDGKATLSLKPWDFRAFEVRP